MQVLQQLDVFSRCHALFRSLSNRHLWPITNL